MIKMTIRTGSFLIVIISFMILIAGCGDIIDIAQQLDEQIEDITPSDTPLNTVSHQKNELMPTFPASDDPELGLFIDGIGPARLVQCFDGDTASFLIDNEVYKVRFLAIDTPEIHSPYTEKQPWSEEAKAYTLAHLSEANEIVLELDQESDITDDYGRLLAWIWTDGELLNAALVRDGYAQVRYLYDDYKYTEVLLVLEQEAIDSKLGIWASKLN